MYLIMYLIMNQIMYHIMYIESCIYSTICFQILVFYSFLSCFLVGCKFDGEESPASSQSYQKTTTSLANVVKNETPFTGLPRVELPMEEEENIG